LRSEVSRFSSPLCSSERACTSLRPPEGFGDEAAFEPESDFAVPGPSLSVGMEGGFCNGLVRLVVFEPDEDGRLEGPEAPPEPDFVVLALAVFDLPVGALAGDELSAEAESVLSLPSINAWYAVFTYRARTSKIDHGARCKIF